MVKLVFYNCQQCFCWKITDSFQQFVRSYYGGPVEFLTSDEFDEVTIIFSKGFAISKYEINLFLTMLEPKDYEIIIQ